MKVEMNYFINYQQKRIIVLVFRCANYSLHASFLCS